MIWEQAPPGTFPAGQGIAHAKFIDGEFWAVGPGLGVHRFQVGSTPLAAADADGVPDNTEDAAPNGGDGNNDGVPDREQPHVASAPAVDGNYITLVAPTNAVLMNVAATPNPSPGDTPPDAQFPMGFLSFTVGGLSPGAPVAVDLLFSPAIAVNAYYKFGLEPTDATLHWYLFDLDEFTGAELVEPGRIRLHFVDGQRGDDDLSANGEITDDGGPAFVISPAPALTVFATATNTIVVSWPSASPEWVLQQANRLATTNWMSPPESVRTDGTNNFIIVDPPAGTRFYRLFRF